MKALASRVREMLRNAVSQGKNLYMVHPYDASLIRIIDAKTLHGCACVRPLRPLNSAKFAMIFETDKFVIQ